MSIEQVKVKRVDRWGKNGLQLLTVLELQLFDFLLGFEEWGHYGDPSLPPQRWGWILLPAVWVVQSTLHLVERRNDTVDSYVMNILGKNSQIDQCVGGEQLPCM